ncbi:hypothetical protein SBD_5198 [Streptomyces bottropensis ATCC 25435]|uniref:Uncharacterized protein n=1 Tax=Streptomyces bottropensis ATCC 25435 TaxID=1054862 RepID=M3FL39_9ACTN|nr:hypothetical protein SBD_5198 [Streptomyces bottropensis ATCC 25435]
MRWGYAVGGIPAETALVRRHRATRGRTRHERLLPPHLSLRRTWISGPVRRPDATSIWVD